MRWTELDHTGSGQESPNSASTTPGLFGVKGLIRSVKTPEFKDVTFHEVLAKSALNKVPDGSPMPFSWTVNPYRGCSHGCVYCFARSTHRYLDLDAGLDFDQQVIVKVNVAEVLASQLAKPKWGHEHVALGTNTDPYQRAEGKYRLMPGIIEALAQHRTPFSVLTKGTLLRRDLPLLARAAEDVPVDLSMSIAFFDDNLQQSVEPGTPRASARLQTVRAAAELGFDVTVFLMPILPALTDTMEHLEHAVRSIAESGATKVIYGALHLRPGAREWFMKWLGETHAELLPRYRRMYAKSSYASREYRSWLSARMEPLLRKYGLKADQDDDTPEGRAAARGRTIAREPGSVPSLATLF
ncbi:MAG: Rv2578c family radical SAM protein [Galactobacter sp.]